MGMEYFWLITTVFFLDKVWTHNSISKGTCLRRTPNESHVWHEDSQVWSQDVRGAGVKEKRAPNACDGAPACRKWWHVYSEKRAIHHVLYTGRAPRRPVHHALSMPWSIQEGQSPTGPPVNTITCGLESKALPDWFVRIFYCFCFLYILKYIAFDWYNVMLWVKRWF